MKSEGKGTWDNGSEAEGDFYCILLGGEYHRLSPDSEGGGIGSAS